MGRRLLTKWLNKLKGWFCSKEQGSDSEQSFSTILCVLDGIEIFLFLKRQLKDLPLQLQRVQTIALAKEKLADGEYRALIIGSHLPDGSGFELASWVREKKGDRFPLAFVSEIYQDAASFRILKDKLKINYILEKPFPPEAGAQLLELLSNLCEAERENETRPQSLALLFKKYREAIPEKIEKVEKLILTVQHAPTLTHLLALRSEIHRLAGSTGSFGFNKVSRLCKEFDAELIRQIALTKEGSEDLPWIKKLGGVFAQLKFAYQLSDPIIDVSNGRERGIYAVLEDNIFFQAGYRSFIEKSQLSIEFNPETALEKLSDGSLVPSVLLCEAHFKGHPLISSYQLFDLFSQKHPERASMRAMIIEKGDWGELLKASSRKIPIALMKPVSSNVLRFLLEASRELGKGFQAIVVDDDPDSREFMAVSFEQIGIETKKVEDALGLQEALLNSRPDLLLIDADLLDEKKIEILPLVRKASNEVVKVALVTTLEDSHLIMKFYGADIADIFIKPFDSQFLQKRILNLLGKNLAGPVQPWKTTALVLERGSSFGGEVVEQLLALGIPAELNYDYHETKEVPSLLFILGPAAVEQGGKTLKKLPPAVRMQTMIISLPAEMWKEALKSFLGEVRLGRFLFIMEG